MIFPRIRYSVLAVSIAALLSACGSTDKPAAQEAAAAPKTPAPVPFNVALCVNGECGVVDQAAAQVVPIENDYDNLSPYVMHDTLLANKDGHWLLLDAKTKATLKTIDGDIYDAAPGYFGFVREGKVGLMDYKGNEVQAPRFDSTFSGGANQYIGFEIGDKRGLLDPQGKPLAEALYDSTDIRDDFDKHGGLVAAERGDAHWIIDLKNGAQKEVPYEKLGDLRDGHMVATLIMASKSGLADASGALVVPMQYEWMGEPGEGLVAFREKSDGACGYLDYQGKVVIEPRFAGCETFGKKGALVKERGADGASGKAGFIDRAGAWLVQPTYVDMGSAGHGRLGMTGHVPGYNVIYKQASALAYDAGIFDANQGKELVAPTYEQIGVLTPDRLLFASKDGPRTSFSFMGQDNPVPAVGLMDASGKVLLKPERYVDIELHKSGRYLIARDGEATAHEALYDLDGHELIGPQWHALQVDEKNAVIFGYEIEGQGDDEVRHLKAAYDLAGKPLFVVKRTDCGAEQLVDGAGKVVWPQDAKPYCAKSAAG